MNSNLKVTLERKGKKAVILMRRDDFAASLHQGNREDKIHWGSGSMWTVTKVEESGN